MSFDHLLVRDVQGERRISAAELPLRLGTSSDSDIRLPGPGGSPVIQLDLLDGTPFEAYKEAIATVFIVYVVYSWVWPSTLRRIMR